MSIFKKLYIILIIICYSSSLLLLINNTNKKEKINNLICLGKKITDSNASIKELINKYDNSDLSNVLSIDGDNYSTIISNGFNNTYYLNHNYDKSKSKDGIPFIDYRVNNTSNIVIIYGNYSGHFNYLNNYLKESYYKKHKYLTIRNDNNKYKYEIISTYKSNDNWIYLDTNLDADSFNTFINKTIENSIYKTNTKKEDINKLLVLEIFDDKSINNNSNHNFIFIVAKLIEEN